MHLLENPQPPVPGAQVSDPVVTDAHQLAARKVWADLVDAEDEHALSPDTQLGILARAFAARDEEIRKDFIGIVKDFEEDADFDGQELINDIVAGMRAHGCR